MSSSGEEGAQGLLGAIPASGAWRFELGPSLHPIGSPQEVASVSDRVVYTFMAGFEDLPFSVLTSDLRREETGTENVKRMARWALAHLPAATLSDLFGNSDVMQALDAGAAAATSCTTPWARGELRSSEEVALSCELRTTDPDLRLSVAQLGGRMVAVVERGAAPTKLAGLKPIS